MRKVPPTERLFGTAENTRTQSMVPGLAGRPVGQRREPESVISGAEGADYDVVIAEHPYGAGHVVYFGDINCEIPTVELLVSYLSSKAAAAAPATAVSTAANPAQGRARDSLHNLAADAAVAAGASAAATASAGYPDTVNDALAAAERRRFPVGAHVRLCGLASKPELNGERGHVLQFDAASGRFCVERLVAGPGESHGIRVKPANLEPLDMWYTAVSEVQKLVDEATRRGDGARVSLPQGAFDYDNEMIDNDTETPLNIGGAISLVGKGIDKTMLHFEVVVGENVAGKLLHLAHFSVLHAPMSIRGKRIERVHLLKVGVEMRGEMQKDALTLSETSPGKYAPDKVLLEECEVAGGSDGVMISVHGCTLRKCRILDAYSRGIFANDSFIIEDSVVQGCGGYGMKTRAGCDRRGRNNIQAGPWDGHMTFGEDANPHGMPPPGGIGGFGVPGFGFPGGFPGGYDDDDDEGEDDDEEIGPYGFTHEEEMELLSQGVKPWDDDAHAVLGALNGDY